MTDPGRRISPALADAWTAPPSHPAQRAMVAPTGRLVAQTGAARPARTG